MSHPELVIPVVLNEKRGEIFANQFMLAGSHEQFAADNASYMSQIHFLEEAAAQLAWSVSSHVFSPENETALRQKFTGYYNLNQIISDIRSHQRSAMVHDYKMSGADDLSFVNPGTRVSTAKDQVHTATFYPFTLSFHDVEPDVHGKQEKQIKKMFPNLYTQNRVK